MMHGTGRDLAERRGSAPLYIGQPTMNSRRRLTPGFLSAIALAGVAAAWLLFAPVQVGGQAAYAIISGNSMEPGLHRGDLVVLRRTSDYQVGDIATYRHPTLGPVIHRIVAVSDGRFTFKGDNNTWLDSYQPTQAEMIGRFWLYAPSAGRIVEQVRQPWAAALLVALGGLAIAISGSAELSRSRGGAAAPAEHIREAGCGDSISSW